MFDLDLLMKMLMKIIACLQYKTKTTFIRANITPAIPKFG